MKYTYLLTDAAALLVPLAASFHPRVNFYRHWKSFLPALAVTALLFIAWDAFFTARGYWGFNDRYITGIYLANLPLEELLFFLCIPYSCLFTYFCMLEFFAVKAHPWRSSLAAWIFIFIALLLGLTHFSRPYTLASGGGLAILLIFAVWRNGPAWLGNCFRAQLFILPAFLLVDGLLTGCGLAQPVVWYNAQAICGYRIATIPVEDIPYGMELILLNIAFYHFFSRRRWTIYGKQ